MTNINLSQSLQQSAGSPQKKRPADKAILISLTILIVTFLIFGGLKAGTLWLDSKKADIDSKIAAEVRNLESEDVERITDFQQRMEQISDNISSKKDTNVVLGQVSQAMISGSVVSSLQSTPGTLSLKIASDNFLVAARQVLSFKKSSHFSNVMIKDINRDQDGKVLFTLNVSL